LCANKVEEGWWVVLPWLLRLKTLKNKVYEKKSEEIGIVSELIELILIIELI